MDSNTLQVQKNPDTQGTREWTRIHHWGHPGVWGNNSGLLASKQTKHYKAA